MIKNEKVFLSGDEYFEHVFEAIDNAREEIILETYIYQRGHLTHFLLSKLQTAISRGVKIKILVDGAGSFGETKELEYFCKSNNIEFKIFHPLYWSMPLTSLRYLNRRDHRKICLIDSSLAFVGSLNWSDDHVSSSNAAIKWKDYGMSFEGDACLLLKLAFERIFYKKTIDLKIKQMIRKKSLESQLEDDTKHIILNNSLLKRQGNYNKLLARIANAKKRIWLANAYIFPEYRMQKQLENAAIRGVDVRLLTSGSKSDVFFMPWMTQLYYKQYLKAGLILYEYLPAFFHGKIFVIDDFVSVGSSNLNFRSVLHDLEVDVALQSEFCKEKITTDLQECFRDSKLIVEHDWKAIPLWKKLFSRLLYLFKTWM